VNDARLSPADWRCQLKVGDKVRVFCGSVCLKDEEVVTSAPESFVTVGKFRGKLSFNRVTGKLCGKRPMAHLFRIEQP